jgi:sugar phosphate isomerase/epimerase
VKIGIDSYCFHRYFGEVYEGLQSDPGVTWRMEDEFLDYALAQGVDEVALESCFFDALDDGLCADIRARLDEAGVDRVLGWGHPEGLWGGTKPEELEALKDHLPQAVKLGATRMRICAASMNYANAPRNELIVGVVSMLKEAAKAAEAHGVTLALENHIDFTSEEVVRILQAVDSEHLRVSTHTKDIATRVKGGSPADNFTFWPSCPAGEGVIDMSGVVDALARGGFDGCLGVEIDLVGEQWVSQSEEEIVANSVAYLRTIVPTEAAV